MILESRDSDAFLTFRDDHMNYSTVAFRTEDIKVMGRTGRRRFGMIKNQADKLSAWSLHVIISIAELFDIKGLFLVIDIRKCNVVP